MCKKVHNRDWVEFVAAFRLKCVVNFLAIFLLFSNAEAEGYVESPSLDRGVTDFIRSCEQQAAYTSDKIPLPVSVYNCECLADEYRLLPEHRAPESNKVTLLALGYDQAMRRIRKSDTMNRCLVRSELRKWLRSEKKACMEHAQSTSQAMSLPGVRNIMLYGHPSARSLCSCMSDKYNDWITDGKWTRFNEDGYKKAKKVALAQCRRD